MNERVDQAVAQATREISKTLRELELRTGCVVRSISLEAIDVTEIRSSVQRVMVQPKIELERLPGREWL